MSYPLLPLNFHENGLENLPSPKGRDGRIERIGTQTDKACICPERNPGGISGMLAWLILVIQRSVIAYQLKCAKRALITST
jgi:hypothetical protein